jgi:hypothetical protein
MNEEGEEVCAESHVDVDIEETISHPKYSPSHLQNDIGLIRIKGTANFRSGECEVYFSAYSQACRVSITCIHTYIHTYIRHSIDP